MKGSINMAVKKRNLKRKQREIREKNAVKIKCCYCDLAGTCPYKVSKERTEKMGIITKCTMTPNRKKKKKKNRKKKTNLHSISK